MSSWRGRRGSSAYSALPSQLQEASHSMNLIYYPNRRTVLQRELCCHAVKHLPFVSHSAAIKYIGLVRNGWVPTMSRCRHMLRDPHSKYSATAYINNVRTHGMPATTQPEWKRLLLDRGCRDLGELHPCKLGDLVARRAWCRGVRRGPTPLYEFPRTVRDRRSIRSALPRA